MTTVGWLAVLAIAALVAGALGYAAGYEDGVEDRKFGSFDDL
jgi:hypothetical protein